MATFYWAAHGASPVILSVFGRLCRKTITRGREDTRSGTPPLHPFQKLNGPSLNIHFDSFLRMIEFTAHAWYFDLSTLTWCLWRSLYFLQATNEWWRTFLNLEGTSIRLFLAIVSYPSTTTFTGVPLSTFRFMADSSIETWTGITSLEILKIDNTQLLINKQETISYFYSWYSYYKGLQRGFIHNIYLTSLQTMEFTAHAWYFELSTLRWFLWRSLDFLQATNI